jgi:hypothetical protein
MADEITLQSRFTMLQAGQPQPYTSPWTQGTDSLQTTGYGPTPGMVNVPTDGVDVVFTELTRPGWLEMYNYDDDNYVEFGLHDGSLFHPLGEIPPQIPIRIVLSRNLGVEMDVVGTGTSGIVNSLHLRANGAECQVFVGAFER